MATCNNCKYLTDVNKTVAPDKGWCAVWQSWQKILTKSCQYCTPKEQHPKGNAKTNSRLTTPNLK